MNLQENLNRRIAEVYKYLGLSMLVATLGALIGMQNTAVFSSMLNFILLIVLELGVLIAFFVLHKKEPINKILYFVFSFISGLTLTPILAKAISIDPAIVLNSFLLTSIIVGSLSMYAMNTKKDYQGMGQYLFIALIALIVAGLLNLFFQSPIMHLVLSFISALLFSAYLVYDTQNIVKGRFESPMMAAIGVYIDILNIFVSILSIFINLTSSDD